MYQNVKAAVPFAALCGCGLSVMLFSAMNYVVVFYLRLHPSFMAPLTSEMYFAESFLLFVVGTALAIVGFGRALDNLLTA